jgi:hypothetical protein
MMNDENDVISTPYSGILNAILQQERNLFYKINLLHLHAMVAPSFFEHPINPATILQYRPMRLPFFDNSVKKMRRGLKVLACCLRVIVE